MSFEFKQTNELTDILEKYYSDEGFVDLVIERQRGNKVMLYCVYKGIRLLQMGPIPLARIGDQIQVEGLRVRLERPS